MVKIQRCAQQTDEGMDMECVLRPCWRTCHAVPALRKPRISVDRGSFARSECLANDLQHCHSFLGQNPGVFALQETACSQFVSQSALSDSSWENHERCTAVMMGFMMVPSVSVRHGGYDEEK